MIVISDTSAISNLLLINEIDILRLTFSRITIPNAVYNEICKVESHRVALTHLDWIEIRDLTDRRLFNTLLEKLDVGEAEAIALAVELQADFLLIDEAHGRSVAEALGLEITGILGVLVRAKDAGHIAEVRPLIDQLLTNADFWMTQAVIDTVLEAAGER